MSSFYFMVFDQLDYSKYNKIKRKIVKYELVIDKKFEIILF